jgi:hypothetical protein
MNSWRHSLLPWAAQSILITASEKVVECDNFSQRDALHRESIMDTAINTVHRLYPQYFKEQ